MVIDQLDLLDAFDSEISVPAVKATNELRALLAAYDDSNAFDPADINEIVAQFDADGRSRIGVGVKRILALVEDAMSGDRAQAVDSFVEQLGEQINRVNPL
jgi:hypothetical protein